MAVIDFLSREERNLFNPAFAGLLVTRAVQGHEQDNSPGCHLLLAVLAPVMAFTAPVRAVLPKTSPRRRSTGSSVNRRPGSTFDKPRRFLARSCGKDCCSACEPVCWCWMNNTLSDRPGESPRGSPVTPWKLLRSKGPVCSLAGGFPGLATFRRSSPFLESVLELPDQACRRVRPWRTCAQGDL